LSTSRKVTASPSSLRDRRVLRGLDLFIAATAVAANVPLFTRNPADFAGLGELLDIVTVGGVALRLTASLQRPPFVNS